MKYFILIIVGAAVLGIYSMVSLNVKGSPTPIYPLYYPVQTSNIPITPGINYLINTGQL